VRCGKSEVTIIKDCARGSTLLKLTTDSHKASRGLSATAELLVILANVMYQNESLLTAKELAMI